ncbi:hypothetical protein [Treponema endosymbiont of Eucomonympha sp.]|uniref:hypothetical protein n=1 Tax=Treponema endosymbiont of Eucomonympha sp. TaxID=1580831 RepID=UPI00075167DA|nr:hypothetical protein [Treponema endosymbiont of Eucomonympha sp.]
MKRIISGVVLLGFLSGCMTTYKGAYKDIPLSRKDMAIIRTSGNELTSAESVEVYMLGRCEEIGAERGYTHFYIIDERLDTSIQSIYSTANVSSFSTNSGGETKCLFTNEHIDAYSDLPYYDCQECFQKAQALDRVAVGWNVAGWISAGLLTILGIVAISQTSE